MSSGGKTPRSSLVMYSRTSTAVRSTQGKLCAFVVCLRQMLTDPRRGFEYSCCLMNLEKLLRVSIATHIS